MPQLVAAHHFSPLTKGSRGEQTRDVVGIQAQFKDWRGVELLSPSLDDRVGCSDRSLGWLFVNFWCWFHIFGLALHNKTGLSEKLRKEIRLSWINLLGFKAPDENTSHTCRVKKNARLSLVPVEQIRKPVIKSYKYFSLD
jgi:hypothetical protein